jgi:ATP-dependent protease ClpP protease subunit
MCRNASYLIHQLSTEFTGTLAEMTVDLENAQRLMRRSITIYERHSTMEHDTLVTTLGDDRHMDAEECIALGFIDEIVG